MATNPVVRANQDAPAFMPANSSKVELHRKLLAAVGRWRGNTEGQAARSEPLGAFTDWKVWESVM